MKEKWTKLEVNENLSKKYYLDLILNSAKDDFQLSLIDSDNKKILITFASFVVSFRYTYDSFVYDTLDFLEKNYGSEFYTNWCFFKVEDSEYLKWIKKQSAGTFEIYELQHFCILGIDHMIDIITKSEPTISFIN